MSIIDKEAEAFLNDNSWMEDTEEIERIEKLKQKIKKRLLQYSKPVKQETYEQFIAKREKKKQKGLYLYQQKEQELADQCALLEGDVQEFLAMPIEDQFRETLEIEEKRISVMPSTSAALREKRKDKQAARRARRAAEQTIEDRLGKPKTTRVCPPRILIKIKAMRTKGSS